MQSFHPSLDNLAKLVILNLRQLNRGYNNIVTIDRDLKAIKRANKVLDAGNLNEKIKAKGGCGTTYPLKEFDFIVVSGCAVPKKQVLEHIFKNSEPETKIVVRTAKLDMDSFIKNLDPPQNVSIIDTKENYLMPTACWNSYLIIKK